MISSLKPAFDKLEKQLDDLLQTVKPLSSEQQNFKPDAHTWSILQVFRHMMQSEGQIIKYLQKKILGVATTRKASIRAFFRSALLNLAMRLPIKYKVPNVIMVDFEEKYDFGQLSADWKLLRKEIRDFLENIDEQTSQKEIFRHPVVGRMSLLQGLTFMQEHLERHTRQVEGIMQHADFPK
ncbi:DinB family protein [Sphingobacteriales bacterium UPWRP_1]|nr:hypothetical protein BVG80_06925 [Sphingobacteriales bacterium TSM_CSM]PSJ78179.1 DinB family protein [Sphingobacteriales bacterium UPWRP_1]